jgi:hypothetical protein
LPPQSITDIAARVETVAGRFGLQVQSLTPDELVAGLHPARYPVAVYIGGESYVYKVKRPGDAVEALRRYIKDGGFLIVCGNVWPFYIPLDCVGGAYQPSAQPPDPPISSGALGLNIAGPGTREFEKPVEPVTFYAEPGQRIIRELPPSWPFPGDGEQRYRPVSGEGLAAGLTFTPILRLKGASGTDYGPGAALVEHASGGCVLYFWGPIVQGKLGEGILRDALLLAASRRPAASSAEARLLQERVKVLQESAASLRKDIPKLVGARLDTHYLLRQCDEARAVLIDAADAISLGCIDLAREKVDAVDKDLTLLSRRARAIESGVKRE